MTRKRPRAGETIGGALLPERAILDRIQATRRVVSRLPEHSQLSEQAFVSLFAELVTQYGTRSCAAVIERIRQKEQNVGVFLEAHLFFALAKLSRIAEVRPLMVHWYQTPLWQLRMYGAMAPFANAEAKADLLAVMRPIAQMAVSPKDLFDATFCIYAVNRDPKEWASLSMLRIIRFNMHDTSSLFYLPMSAHDIEVLIGYAQFCQESHVMASAVRLLHALAPGSVKKAGEVQLQGSLLRWSRPRIEALGAIVESPEYRTFIHRIARDVRDPVEGEESEFSNQL